jgi:hypothetical protein
MFVGRVDPAMMANTNPFMMNWYVLLGTPPMERIVLVLGECTRGRGSILAVLPALCIHPPMIYGCVSM